MVGRYIRRMVFQMIPPWWKPFFGFIRRDSSRKEKIPLRRKIAMWHRGFEANRCYYYDFDRYDRRLYVSDYFNFLSHPKNGHYTGLIDDKLYLPVSLRGFPEHVPAYHFLLLSGRVLKLGGDRSVVSSDSEEFWDSFMRIVEGPGCVGKPTNQSCGTGVIVFESRSGTLFANNCPRTKEDLLSFFRTQSRYLISERVRQHPYSVRLSPNTTNTIRLLTCWDPDTETPFVARGFHRIGRPAMYGADNGALGGLITQIDLSKGTLGCIAHVHDGRVEYQREHPDSGVPVYGTPIPHFERIQSTLIQMCYELNYVPYIGWDIVVTEDSFKVLELNSNTDVYGYQLFEPLLSDSRLSRFYRQFVTPKNQRYFMR